jgi:hypothetical protein
MQKLSLLINSEVVFEFDRETAITDHQRAFLDKMDSDMDKGIKIGDKVIATPDRQQRATFIAMNLIKALQQDSEAATMSSCAWLINRLPGLIEVHADDDADSVKITLVEE